MSDELLAMICEMGHIDLFVGTEGVSIFIYDPDYVWTIVGNVDAPTLEDAVRKAYEAYQQYVKDIPEGER